MNLSRIHSCSGLILGLLAWSACHKKADRSTSNNPSSDTILSTNTNRAIPKAEILHSDYSLIGPKALSVVVTIEGASEISESAFQSDIESRLREAGIIVIPIGNEAKFPLLQLNVRMPRWSNGFTPSVLYGLSLGYYRLFSSPAADRPEKYVMRMTWSRDYSGTVPAQQITSVRSQAQTLTSEFLKTFQRVNSEK